MKLLVKFNWDCGRQGSVKGLFVTTQKELSEIYGTEIYFGEALGKHSDIHGEITSEDITIVSEDQEFIAKLAEIIGSDTISGYNPFHYSEE